MGNWTTWGSACERRAREQGAITKSTPFCHRQTMPLESKPRIHRAI